MMKEDYQKLVKKHLPREPRLLNFFIAFTIGGLIGLTSELISMGLVYLFSLTKTESYGIVCMILIFASSLLTAMGFFDNWVKKAKCGIIIPTTGFAHSMTSAALEYKKEGMITGIGANVFKLAGSVLLYGILSAFFLCLLRVILWVA